ncbi:hypothetical protein LTR56_027245 [Elasticomyces elasticus]|nr:hypothetical protein LTR56_027245 [Elasticomyces elasticus]KAK3653786.1 hypothetical protein LTR22_011001 [Elasticomyces elasticus]KAK4915988.1 hypothetical protein LTR49_015899 [Elasticomyces elasticus]KAK5755370.1 hypothetical protein LTS12_014477 [Elasticomyces elasticus]
MQDRHPTPDSTPPTPGALPDPTAQPSISTDINVATRKQHTELNRLIVERLPLALSSAPRTWRGDKSPALLALGIAAFAQIYFEFEATWAAVERSEEKTADGTTAEWLTHLRPQDLERTQRLRSDVRRLTRTTGVCAEAVLSELVPDARLLESPHMLIAYAWVMYMAIFSGGRWIRQQLAEAGPDFELAFLSFDGDEDGEDVKRDFKARLLRAEDLMTKQERQDVIEEAQRLFDRCIAVVYELDRQVRWQYTRRVATRAVAALCVVALFFCFLDGSLAWFGR